MKTDIKTLNRFIDAESIIRSLLLAGGGGQGADLYASLNDLISGTGAADVVFQLKQTSFGGFADDAVLANVGIGNAGPSSSGLSLSSTYSAARDLEFYAADVSSDLMSIALGVPVFSSFEIATKTLPSGSHEVRMYIGVGNLSSSAYIQQRIEALMPNIRHKFNYMYGDSRQHATSRLIRSVHDLTSHITLTAQNLKAILGPDAKVQLQSLASPMPGAFLGTGIKITVPKASVALLSSVNAILLRTPANLVSSALEAANRTMVSLDN